MNKIIPAIPTILFSSLLAVDFADIVNRLDMAILGYYFLLIVILVGSFSFIYFKTKLFGHPLTLSFFLLLIASISYPIIEAPVNDFVKNYTSHNDVFAVVKKTYNNDENIFEFTITAQGKGSWDDLQLFSGYTNISVNKYYYKGPSLYYKIFPELLILEHDENPCKKPIEYSLEEAFAQKKICCLHSKEDLMSFKSILQGFSQVRNIDNFYSSFSSYKDSKIGLNPFDNFVYRICFLLISVGALVLSVMFSVKLRG